jgi:diketogulonate reductase-like aldo/keto reductase
MSSEHGTAVTAQAIEDSLSGIFPIEYFDLILLHDPNAGSEKRLEAYKTLLKAQEEGKTNNIGVSSFGVRHLKEIEDAGLPAPCKLC